MKKNIRIIFVSLLSIVTAASLCWTAFAETYYVLDGFTYREVDNGVSIHAWDHSADTLTVPQLLGGERVTEIDDFAFNYDENIESIDFSEASYLTTIGKMAFLSSGLSGELILSPSITKIGTGAFQSCSELTSVYYNAALDEIPNQCFKNCTSLSSFVFFSAVQKIGAYAFQNCTSLEYIAIPKSVTEINATAFNGDSVTIGCYYDSYAYRFAVSKSIPYVLLDGVNLGDVNGDGYVNINDVTSVQRHLAELETLNGIYLHAADANQDGKVDISDATEIQLYLAEYELEHPISEVIKQ